MALVVLDLRFGLARSGDLERAVAFVAVLAGLALLHHRLMGSPLDRP